MRVLRVHFRVELLLLVVCCSVNQIVCQDCESKETCDQCIQELNCFWCTVANNAKSHCIKKSNIDSCPTENTEDPQGDFSVVDNRPLTESEQISPQKIRLKLRRNEKYEINFSYKQSDNYPVDLYYIMDLSNSMNSSKQQLADLGKDLATEMRRKTNNFIIGFGSFVDKLTLPYVNTYPEALEHPCKGCASPYSFKNHLSLQPDASLFSRRVKETELSGNLDTPEGGLDAIMQAMVCKKEIGWRPNARHLLVMSTDAVSHIAGDGKLGGVIEPNDAQCHMVNNTYTEGLVYDYPSVSQINYVARQNNINIIFAIVTKAKDPDHLKNHYKAMSGIIENSKTGTLDENSNNVVRFISDIYDQITDLVKITSDATKDVSVNITSTCRGFVDGGCSSVKPGQKLAFTATIQPLICHEDAQLNKKIIKIKPEGLEDSLIVELEVLCDCKCAADKKNDDPICSSFGSLECGICRCKEGHFGESCQCDRRESKTTDPSACIKPGGKNETCSGQGKCLCGKCVCRKRADETEHIYGKYCECDDFSCPLKCSGNGRCNCGECDCAKGWSGAACDCLSDNTQCFAAGSNVECSGNGKCVCGHCQCNADAKERYTGKYCEICASCTAQRCDELKPCVECQAYNSGIYMNNSSCTENCNIFNTSVVDKLAETPADGARRCRFVVEKNCDILFEYSEEDTVLRVTAQKERICTTPVSLVVWISGVIASVLLIGIITLIAWKIITTIHDKNEYAKFMSERNQTQWSAGENPLYKPGTSHFQNPAYMRASQRFSAMNAAKKSDKVPGEIEYTAK